MENQDRNLSYDSSEMGDKGRNVNRRGGDQSTGQPQLFKDDFTNQSTNMENCDNRPDFTSSGQVTNYSQQTRNDDYMNQNYKTSCNDEYENQGYKNTGSTDGYGNQSYGNAGNDEYMNQGFENSGQDTSFLQQTGGGVMNIAQGAVQGAATMAKGAAVGAANIAQGAAMAVKSTLAVSTDTDSTTTGTTDHPSYPNTRV